MTLRQFQYCIIGYDQREKRKMHMLANLAIMINNPKKIRQIVSPGRDMIPFKKTPGEGKEKTIGKKTMSIEEIRSSENPREALKKWNEIVAADFQKVRDSPTYKKTQLNTEQMIKRLRED